MGKSTAKGKMIEEAGAGSATLPTQEPTAAPISADPQTGLELEQQIRELAYQLYEQRGGQNGSAEQDWLEAEAMILGRKELAA